MDNDQPKPTDTTLPAPTATSASAPKGPAVTGLVPPERGEAIIREAWPSVASGGLSRLAHKLMRTIILAPVAWLLLLPLFLKKIGLLPFAARPRRYTLTNRRLMIQKGLKPKPLQEIPLAAIDDILIDEASKNNFYRCADLEVWSQGKMALKLTAVPEAESFRRAVINAYKAWVPGKASGPFIPASAPAKT
jgi:hypothetical protein